MNENQEIDERCSCGATFRWRGEFVTHGREAAADWRRGHHHRSHVPEIYDNRAVRSEVPTPVRRGDPRIIESVRDVERSTAPGLARLETNAVHVIDARHTDSHTIYTCAVCGYAGLDVPDLPCPGKAITGGGPCLAG